MKRATAIYSIAKIITEVITEERGDAQAVIDYVTGKTPALNTWTNTELAEQLEYMTGDTGVQVEGGETVDPEHPIALQLTRHESILLSNLLGTRVEQVVKACTKSYPDTEAGHFAKHCDARYLAELRTLADRIEERIRDLDVVKQQQYREAGLTDPET